MDLALSIRFLADHAITLSLAAGVVAAAVAVGSSWKHGLPLLLAVLGVIWGSALLQKSSAYYSLGARRCRVNLQAIVKAKQSWATAHQKLPSDVPEADDLFGPGHAFPRLPICPLYGHYRLGAVNELPECNHAPSDWVFTH